MSSAPCADENQVESLLSYLGITDGFSVLTELALDVPSSTKGGVFNALGVNSEILCFGCVVSPIHTVVKLVALASLLSAIALLALKLQEVPIAICVLTRVKHIVALRAESHAFVLVAASVELRLRNHHFA